MTPYDHHPGADWRTPLRMIVCLPVRCDDGTWFGVPMYQLPVEDAEDIKRAERIAVERYRKKIARAEP